MLDEIRKRDAGYGEKIPDHYQGPHDRRYLLKLIDLLEKKIEKLENPSQETGKDFSRSIGN